MWTRKGEIWLMEIEAEMKKKREVCERELRKRSERGGGRLHLRRTRIKHTGWCEWA